MNVHPEGKTGYGLSHLKESAATSTAEEDEECLYAAPLSWREFDEHREPSEERGVTPKEFSAPTKQLSFPGNFGEETDDGKVHSLVATSYHVTKTNANSEQDPEIVPDSLFEPRTTPTTSLPFDQDFEKKRTTESLPFDEELKEKEAWVLSSGTAATTRGFASMPHVSKSISSENEEGPFDESFGMIPVGCVAEPQTQSLRQSNVEPQASPGAEYVAGIGDDHPCDDWDSALPWMQDAPRNTAAVAAAQEDDRSMELIEANLVEEPVITEANAISEEELKRKRQKAFAFAIMIMLAIILAIVLSVVLVNKNSSPRVEPTASPTPAPTTMIQVLIENLSPDSVAAFDDASSPQSEALAWIEQDSADLFGLPDSNFTILQRFALATFFFSTGGNQWIRNDTWLSAANECGWSSQQLVCDDNEYAVVKIRLDFNRLKGTLPMELTLLTSLEYLDLTSNLLDGSIPTQIKSMEDLKYILLEGNSISGTIPTEIGLLSKLFSLILSSNRVEGRIPTEIGLLRDVREFLLDGNQLSGDIPSQIQDLSFLDAVLLSENRLEGEIPSGMFLLDGLVQLGLDVNALSGTIPIASNGTIPSSKYLEVLKLGSNFLTGTIPNLGPFSSLKTLTMEKNILSGTIQPSLGMLSDIETLSLSFNDGISGSIPSEIGRLEKLEKAELNGLSLTGSIPSEVGLMRSVQTLDLSKNTLTGRLPTELGMMSRLETLKLAENQLSGNLVSEIGLLENLKIVAAETNQFSGPLPTEIGSLSSLERIVLLRNDDLNGTLPSEFGLATRLDAFYLSGSFTGPLPTEIGLLSNMIDFFLYPPRFPSGKSLSGSLPSEIAKIRNLRALSLTSTGLSGSLPSEFGTLTDLTILLLTGADLSGPVGDLCKLREDKLLTLDIGCNTSCSCCADTCGPTVASPTECEADETFVQVVVVTDQNPQENSWQLVDSGSGETLLEDGPYSPSEVFKEFSKSVCIRSDTCAVLRVNDSGGDGICCHSGRGSFSVFVSGEEKPVYTVSEFETFSESDGLLACAPTEEPTKAPTPLECDEASSSLLRIEITTDQYPDETSWELSVDGEIVSRGAPNPDAPETLNVDEICIPLDTCVIFTIFDELDDGLCCFSGDGMYRLFLDEVEIASGAEFGSSESVAFGTCSPTNSPG